MNHDDTLRREGMADAAVLLTAKHVIRTMSLNDWARALDLNELDVQHAVQRIKARAANLRTPPPHGPQAAHVQLARASRTAADRRHAHQARRSCRV